MKRMRYWPWTIQFPELGLPRPGMSWSHGFPRYSCACPLGSLSSASCLRMASGGCLLFCPSPQNNHILYKKNIGEGAKNNRRGEGIMRACGKKPTVSKFYFSGLRATKKGVIQNKLTVAPGRPGSPKKKPKVFLDHRGGGGGGLSLPAFKRCWTLCN